MSKAPDGMSFMDERSIALVVTISCDRLMKSTFISLGLIHGISPDQNSGFFLLGVPPPHTLPSCFKFDQVQPDGSSKSLTSRSFSSEILSNSIVAGSSSGFCGTSLPRTASRNTNSRSRATPFGASAMVSKCAMKSRGLMSCVPALPPALAEAAPARPPPHPVPSRSAPAIRRDLRGRVPARSGSRGPG